MTERPKIRKPDIAFWFDEKETDMYEVVIKHGIEYQQIILAAFDLMSKAIRIDMKGGTKILEYDREEDEEE